MKTNWKGDAITARLKKELADKLQPTLQIALERIHGYIGTQGPPRSAPGAPPHMDSQQLYDSFAIEVDASGLKARLGSFVPWSVYLEEGTPEMEARPFFLMSIVQTTNDMARELGK